jgi:transcriptional regulator with XRE-family HTH domain
MSFQSMSNQSIAKEIGRRIEQMRLEQNLTQRQVADEIGLSRLSYRRLVNGSGKFENIIALLRVLGRLDLLERFVPEVAFSPMQQLKLKGKQRRRASGLRAPDAKPGVTEVDTDLDW